MPEPIPIISHTPPSISLSPDTPTPSPLPSSTNSNNTLKVKRSRPKLLKRLSAQSLLTRSKNSSSVSLVEKPVTELKRTPSFSLSTPSITTATYQKEVVTSTAVDVGQQEERREETMMRSSSPETPQPTCDTSQFLSPSPSPPRHLRKSLSTSSLVSSPSVSRRSSLSSLSTHHTVHSDNDDHKKMHKSMPLLSHQTFQQLVPGCVAGQCDYPLASAKRNHDFHLLFRSVPELDPLIEVYKCALQKEILLQGHIYISEHHLCFNANIFGWVTNLVIAFSDITSIEKRMTAMIIPNGIQISTVHAKHIFASFMSRDMAFDQMYKIWQMHHGTGDMQTLQPRDNSDFSLKRHDDDEDDEDDMHSDSETEASELDDEAIVHAPHCECTGHMSHVVLDATYKGTVKIMHELLFESSFFPKALKKYEGCQDLTVGKWDGQIRESFYKRQVARDEDVQIRCFRKDELVAAKFPDYCAVESTVRAPDTPMGDAIALRIWTCITLVSPAKVRVFVTFQIDTTKSSPIQALVEKDIFDNQTQFYGRLGRVLKSKSTRRRIEKRMEADGMLRRGQESHETSLIRRILSGAQKAGDMAMASVISVVSTLFHLLFQLDGQQLLVLCLCTALLTNVLMAYRISSISDQLERMAAPKGTIGSPIKANDKKYGIGQLEQSIDGIHRAMMQLQEDVGDQSDRLHRLRRL
ncbi:hypothetical protein BJV82DRAFT_595022 [Fennellomyces sp. T-0311]|nr:hypothetical protein BJV82DRAFT_595022 [Fennellomyces sp. T-0311]